MVVQDLRGRVFVIEVKSRISNSEDLIRGVYQCVKYRAVMAAQRCLPEKSIMALLVVETDKVESTIQNLLKQNRIACLRVSPDRRKLKKLYKPKGYI